MKDETTSTAGSSGYRLKRRKFLANLLFAGGALSLSGLQAAQAQQNPTDGWTLPDLNQSDPKPTPTPPPPPVRGEPIPQPQPPPTPGRPAPPPPRGKVVLPPKGDYSSPKPGEAVAPSPPKK